jgi:hypothetical protein
MTNLVTVLKGVIGIGVLLIVWVQLFLLVPTTNNLGGLDSYFSGPFIIPNYTYSTSSLSTLPILSDPLWNSSNTLPLWMKDYFQWHALTRQQLSLENWNSGTHRPRLLVLQCIPGDLKCGGTADRLKPIPLLVLAAARSDLLFLIRWVDRPCRLQEFLVPPRGGMDWTVPEWLEEILKGEYDFNFQKRRHILNIDFVLKIPPSIPDIQVITAKLQWYVGLIYMLLS